MSDNDKLAAFGQWLTERTIQHEAMLYSACGGCKNPESLIRMKYGQLEALKTCLQAFTLLFEKDIENFRKEFMSEEQDGAERAESTDID